MIRYQSGIRFAFAGSMQYSCCTSTRPISVSRLEEFSIHFLHVNM